MQSSFADLLASDIVGNAAYDALLRDYVTYHAVLVVGGAAVVLVGLFVSAASIRALIAQGPGRRALMTTFERRAILFFAIVGAVAALLMLLIVVANASNVIAPRTGFAMIFPASADQHPVTQKAQVQAAAAAWIERGTGPMPAVLKDAVRDRLAWQRPKAVVCSLVFLLFAFLTATAWKRLIRRSRLQGGSAKRIGPISVGVATLGFPATGLAMIMALANTQAAFAPIVISISGG